jgi:hypothetical protein
MLNPMVLYEGVEMYFEANYGVRRNNLLPTIILPVFYPLLISPSIMPRKRDQVLSRTQTRVPGQPSMRQELEELEDLPFSIILQRSWACCRQNGSQRLIANEVWICNKTFPHKRLMLRYVVYGSTQSDKSLSPGLTLPVSARMRIMAHIALAIAKDR